jgi:hypothetical protein
MQSAYKGKQSTRTYERDKLRELHYCITVTVTYHHIKLTPNAV